MIAANNSSLLAFDNLSHVQNWLSDALCRLSTGGGFATRELYSDGEERLFDAMRPVMLNGVEALGMRSDLLDRCITVELPMIPEEKRRTEADLWRDFEPVRPRILGTLLDAVPEGIRNLETVRLDRLPRMADFARFAVASERALGLGAGAFMRAYADNREAANALALETAVIGPAVVELMETRDRWEGTPQDLLAALSAEPYTDGATRNRQDWPKTPRGLSAALRRLAPNLRRLRIETTFVRKPGGNRSRMIFLERVGDIPSHTVPPSIPEAENAVGRDEAGTVRDGMIWPTVPRKPLALLIDRTVGTVETLPVLVGVVVGAMGSLARKPAPKQPDRRMSRPAEALMLNQNLRGGQTGNTLTPPTRAAGGNYDSYPHIGPVG